MVEALPPDIVPSVARPVIPMDPVEMLSLPVVDPDGDFEPVPFALPAVPPGSSGRWPNWRSTR